MTEGSQELKVKDLLIKLQVLTNGLIEERKKSQNYLSRIKEYEESLQRRELEVANLTKEKFDLKSKLSLERSKSGTWAKDDKPKFSSKMSNEMKIQKLEEKINQQNFELKDYSQRLMEDKELFDQQKIQLQTMITIQNQQMSQLKEKIGALEKELKEEKEKKERIQEQEDEKKENEIKEKMEKERIEKEEKERREKWEKERIEKEEKERREKWQEWEKWEKDRIEKEEKERREKWEKEKREMLEKEKREKEKKEKEKKEKESIKEKEEKKAKGKKVLQHNEKYFLVDHGFYQAKYGEIENIGSILENIVYIELLRRGYDVKIGMINEKEIDFVCTRDKEKIYIQVTYQLESDKTIEREFSGLAKINDNFDKYVLSMDKLDFSGNGLKHRNIIDFLISDYI